jgi:hypothetical protein
MEHTRFAWSIAAGLAAVAAGVLAGPAEAFTTKYYAWVTPSAECPTTSSNLPDMDDMLDAWSEKMADKGWPDGGHLVDGNINLDRFCDPDSGISGCSDYSNGIDEADAVMVGIHGNDFGDHWQGLLRDSGTSGFNCQTNTSGDLRAGDADVDFLHLVSCHSLDDDNLVYAGDMMEDPADSPSNGRRLQLLTGFHGDTACSSGRVGDYRQVAKDGFKGSTADAWMDNLYDGSVQYAGVNGTYELCPVAYSIGSSDADCDDRLLSTGYGGLSTDPSSSSHWCATAYDGCDPYNETAFTAP